MSAVPLPASTKPKPSAFGAPPVPQPVLVTRAPRELLLISGHQGRDTSALRRALARLDTAVHVVQSTKDAASALSRGTAGIIVDAPLADRSAEEVLDALSTMDRARACPVFVVVDDEFADRRARELYAAGAAAVVAWPEEILLLPRLVAQLLGVSLADNEAATTNAALTEATSARINVDPELENAVTCIVRGGVACLQGSLDSLWKARLVRSRVGAVPGIVAIDDANLQIDAPEVPDEDLSAAISTLLRATASIEERTLCVSASGGQVTLAGVVDSKRRLRQLESIVEAVRGVRSIVNHASVSRAAVARGKGQADALKNALSRAFPSSRVRATVFGNVAVLTGTTQTLAARQEIVEMAEDANFVERVVNKIEVKS